MSIYCYQWIRTKPLSIKVVTGKPNGAFQMENHQEMCLLFIFDT